MNKSKVSLLVILVVLALGLIAFPAFMPEEPINEVSSVSDVVSTTAVDTTQTAAPSAEKATVDKDGYYYDFESVVLYLDAYGKLPSNYITKRQAQSLGWSGGALDRYQDGAAIGGDRFGNYEKLLPTGASYTECDIDTKGKSRGAKRLVFSSGGQYYYTDDHYESFTEYTVRDGKVVKK